MKVVDLKNILDSYPDNFQVIINIHERIPDDKLKSMSYPYPYETTKHDNLEFDDVAWSDRQVVFSVTIGED